MGTAAVSITEVDNGKIKQKTIEQAKAAVTAAEDALDQCKREYQQAWDRFQAQYAPKKKGPGRPVKNG